VCIKDDVVVKRVGRQRSRGRGFSTPCRTAVVYLLWAHRYKLYAPYRKTIARCNYFSYRVSRIWNALQLDDVDFESVHRFHNSLTANVLVRYCKLNFI